MANSKKGHPTRLTTFDDLRPDIALRIFSTLPHMSLVACTLVCSSWHDMISFSPSVWRGAYTLHRRRQESRRIQGVSSATILEKEEEETKVGDVDFRALYINEEHRRRLADGPVSTLSWKAHSGRVNCCRMVMGQVVSGSSDGTVKLWCAGQNITYKVPGKARVVQVEFDESKVMGAAGKDVFVWSRTSNRRLLKRMGGYSEICSICVADSDISMGCTDGTVRVFDLYSSTCKLIFRMHTEPVKAVVMDMATQSMASGSSDGTVQLFDARSGQKIVSLLKPPSATPITCLHSSPLGQKLFAASQGGILYCFDSRSQKPIWLERVGGAGLTCLDSPAYSSSTISVGGIDGEIKVFEADSAKCIATLKMRGGRLPSSPVLSMALGMTEVISSHADGNLVQWQLGEQFKSGNVFQLQLGESNSSLGL